MVRVVRLSDTEKRPARRIARPEGAPNATGDTLALSSTAGMASALCTSRRRVDIDLSKLTHGNPIGDGPIVPCAIICATSPKSAGRTRSFVVVISSILYHRHAAWTSCSKGSHPAVDGSNRSVRHAKKVSTEYRD
jgi:hypothetical protein